MKTNTTFVFDGLDGAIDAIKADLEAARGTECVIHVSIGDPATGQFRSHTYPNAQQAASLAAAFLEGHARAKADGSHDAALAIGLAAARAKEA